MLNVIVLTVLSYSGKKMITLMNEAVLTQKHLYLLYQSQQVKKASWRGVQVLHWEKPDFSIKAVCEREGIEKTYRLDRISEIAL